MQDRIFKPGDRCGGYTIERFLGSGGFAEVYQAARVGTGETVALKCLQRRHSKNAYAKERMIAEGELLAVIRHQNLVHVYEVGIDRGILFMAMEFLSGRTLREVLKKVGGRLPIAKALYVGREIADGVDAAHELNVVHRDLKPDNVMITDDGRVKVVDMGAAKFFGWGLQSTATGNVIGTPLYMAPEHVQGRDIDARSDVYAVGTMLYEMIAGHFLAKQREEGISRWEAALLQINYVPPPLVSVVPACPADVSELVHRAMAKRPEDRFPSMSELAQALRRVRKRLHEEMGAVALATSGDMSAGAMEKHAAEEAQGRRFVVVPDEVATARSTCKEEHTAEARRARRRATKQRSYEKEFYAMQVVTRRRWAMLGVLVLGFVGATMTGACAVVIDPGCPAADEAPPDTDTPAECPAPVEKPCMRYRIPLVNNPSIDVALRNKYIAAFGSACYMSEVNTFDCFYKEWQAACADAVKIGEVAGIVPYDKGYKCQPDGVGNYTLQIGPDVANKIQINYQAAPRETPLIEIDGVPTEVNGPYRNLTEPQKITPGERFYCNTVDKNGNSVVQRALIIQTNSNAHGGVIHSDLAGFEYPCGLDANCQPILCKEPLVLKAGSQYDPDAAEVHHVVRRKDLRSCSWGTNSNKNAVVISRKLNGRLLNNYPSAEEIERVNQVPAYTP